MVPAPTPAPPPAAAPVARRARPSARRRQSRHSATPAPIPSPFPLCARRSARGLRGGGGNDMRLGGSSQRVAPRSQRNDLRPSPRARAPVASAVLEPPPRPGQAPSAAPSVSWRAYSRNGCAARRAWRVSSALARADGRVVSMRWLSRSIGRVVRLPNVSSLSAMLPRRRAAAAGRAGL